MKKFLFGVLTLMIAASAPALSVPEWVKRSAKNVAFDHLVKRMKNGPFYRVNQVETSEVKSASGEEHALVIIHFEDSNGCKARMVGAECVPAEGETVYCELSVTGCTSSENSTTAEVFGRN